MNVFEAITEFFENKNEPLNIEADHTFAGSPEFSGNPKLSGSAVFGAVPTTTVGVGAKNGATVSVVERDYFNFMV